MSIQHIDSPANILFSMPIGLMCWFIAFSCGKGGIIIILPLMEVPSLIASLSLITNRVAVLFIPQFLWMVNCRGWTEPRNWGIILLTSLPLFLLSCSVVCLCMILWCLWLCACLVFLHLHSFHGYAWTANCPGLYIILMLYCCICSSIFEACVIGLQHLSWILLPTVCDLWSCLPHGQSSSGGVL